MKIKELKELIANLPDDAGVHVLCHVPYEVQETKVLHAHIDEGALVIECEPLEVEEFEEEE